MTAQPYDKKPVENMEEDQDPTLQPSQVDETVSPVSTPVEEGAASPLQADETVDLVNLVSGDSVEIERLEAENAKLKEQLVRALAETENLRKRSDRQIEEAQSYGMSGFARDLVDVLENLHRAMAALPEEGREDSPMLANLITGVEMTLNNMMNTFEKHGIQRLDPMGEKFDHNTHQAIARIPDPDHEPGTVVQVIQAGYTVKDRLLRPAMVGVATAPENPPGTPESVDTQA